ncbi:hypothetical protein DVH24_027917 [Malus domestica]|uniref:F-box domain-containing protein n=1 Tax=Malus domestica TaxID=3750 RepID=A0A498HAA9_MALDO|nr:hypothetical protein DVH24_027917 [Malus domestica]
MAEGGLPERQTQLVPSDHGACIFTNDIIIEIPSWVPGKSLLRFRRVCKSWRTLISDPYFVRKQLSHTVRRIINNNNDNLRLLTFTSTRHLRSIDYESLLTLLAKNKHENVSRVVVPRCRKHKLLLVEPQRRFVQIMGSSNGLMSTDKLLGRCLVEPLYWKCQQVTKTYFFSSSLILWVRL